MKVVLVAVVVVVLVALSRDVSAGKPTVLNNCQDKCDEWQDQGQAGECKAKCPGCAALAKNNAGNVVAACKSQACPQFQGDQQLCIDACNWCGVFAGEA